MLEIANEVEVAPWSDVLPSTESVLFALSAPPTLRTLLTVDEPVTASEVEVAPAAVSPPLKASCVVVALERNG